MKNETDIEAVLERLRRIEEALAVLLSRQTMKEYYTTAEIAEILGRAEFTVREWCRLGRVNAEKRLGGRGNAQEWVIAHQELLRIQHEGLLPQSNAMPEFDRRQSSFGRSPK